MSTCNCDGTISTTFQEDLFGDSVINSLGIYESMFSGISAQAAGGAADPRPPACQQAAGQLRAGGEDPCNLDSPDDLQQLYQSNILSAWNVIKSTPTSNPLQRAADQAAGTANAPPKNNTPPAPNYLFIIGAIVIVAFGFLLVFR